MNKEYFVKLYSTYKLIIFPSVVVLSCLVLIATVIFPQISNLIGNSKTENQLRVKIKNIDTKAQALESVDENDLSSKLKIALSLYPSDSEPSYVIGVFQEVTARYGFNIGSLHLGGSTQAAKGSVLEFNVKLELTGPRMLLKDLITNIENAPRIMKIDNMEIANTRIGDNVDVSLNVKVYYQPFPNSFGDIDTPLPTISDKEEAVLASLAKAPVFTISGFSAFVPKGKANPFE